MRLKDLIKALNKWEHTWQYDAYENNKSDWTDNDDYYAATVTQVLQQKIKEMKNVSRT
jgi:hypothetical protein